MTTDRFDIADATAKAFYEREREQGLFAEHYAKPWEELSHLERNLRRDCMDKALSEYQRLTTPTDHAGLKPDTIWQLSKIKTDYPLHEDAVVAINDAIAALQAPVPAEVERRAKDLKDIANLYPQGGNWIRKSLEEAATTLRTLSRTNEALTREHAARVAKVRSKIEDAAEIIAASEDSNTRLQAAGLRFALAIIAAEFPPAALPSGEDVERENRWMDLARAATELVSATDSMETIRPQRQAVLDAMKRVLASGTAIEAYQKKP